MTEKRFPLAETFTSPQGEGLYAGAMMQFVRLAGCSVGKKINDAERFEWSAKLSKELEPAEERDGAHYSALRTLPVIPNYIEKCSTWDGRGFLCDTDFRTKEMKTAREIIEGIPEGVESICVTGGEPLNYDLTELLDAAYEVLLDVHIETSGTVPLRHAFPKFDASDLIGDSVRGWLWVTVSPKLGCLDEMVDTASQLKFLVDENFDADKIPEKWRMKPYVYISPINGEHTVDRANVDRCIELQKQYPHWRICMQIHKFLGVR